MNNSEQIPLSPNGLEILQKSHQAFSEALKGKFNCTAIIHGLGSHCTSPFNNESRKIQAEVKYSIQMAKGLKISVWKDDLTTHKVDAVVNAANEHLSHGGGLALALSRAGGPQINKESRDIIKRQKKVPTGKAVVTTAGNLPCKWIIHAVGPEVRKHASRKEIDDASVLLQKVIMSILELVKAYGLQSVAIPALSSGLFNFPLPNCANVIAHSLRFYHDNRFDPRQNLEIRLVNHDNPSVQEMEKACRHILGQSDISASCSVKKGEIQKGNAFGRGRASAGSAKYPPLPSTSGASSWREPTSSPYIEIFAPSEEALIEAKYWTMKMLYPTHAKRTIYNDHIRYFDKKDHEELMNFQAMFEVTINLFFKNSKRGIDITGSPSNVSVAVLRVEAMLYKAQEKVVHSEQEHQLNKLCMAQKLDGQKLYKRTVDSITEQQKMMFHSCGLNVVKVEKIENYTLNRLFELSRKTVPGEQKKMYQRVKAQFCEAICRAGFHREYTSPEEYDYGTGIYFTTGLDKVMKLWGDNEDEEFVYIVVAQVLTGNQTEFPLGVRSSCHGCVVNAQRDVYVLFNGQQALPESIVTCKVDKIRF